MASALPVFGRSRGANVYYTARSHPLVNLTGGFASFDHYDPDGMICLSPSRFGKRASVNRG